MGDIFCLLSDDAGEDADACIWRSGDTVLCVVLCHRVCAGVPFGAEDLPA